MADTLEIFGVEYPNATGIKATDDNGVVRVFIRPTGTKSISANGTGIDVSSYASVDVAVPSGTPSLQSKSVSFTPTETAQSQTVTADSGYDGLDSVGITVNAVPSGGLVQTVTGSVTPNITVSNTGLIEAYGIGYTENVNPVYQSGYIDSSATLTVTSGASATYQLSTQAAKTVTPSTSAQTAVAAGKYTTGAVTVAAMPSGTAGTPTATKGTVSNHAISVTPSVTNTTGYITGGTQTGTAVTVSASELVSGSETKTANGTFDVTNLAELIVNVQPKTATGTFTGNGTRTIDVTCAFEPDLIYVRSNPGTTASSGTVAFIIARGMMAATRYRNNSTMNSHYAAVDITNMNTGGSSYSWRATYSTTTGKVTLYCFSSSARGLLTNGRTYSYTFMKWT